MPTTLAYITVGEIAKFVIPFGLFVLVPVIAMLLSHQRKMASLMFQRPMEDTALLHKLDQIQSELRDLRGRVDQQTLLLDDHGRVLEKRLAPEKQQIEK